MPFDYSTKLWFKQILNKIAIRRARDAMNELGYSLPCEVTAVSGQMVTVKWKMDTSPWTLQPVTIPCAGQSQWNYLPTQVGDTGITIAADVLLGEIIGTSTTTATFRVPGNLSALMFLPVGTKGFTPTDANAFIGQGPNGFIFQSTTGTTCSIVGNSNGITFTFGSHSIVINSSGVTIDGIVFDTHTHSAGTLLDSSGGAVTGDTGAPV